MSFFGNQMSEGQGRTAQPGLQSAIGGQMNGQPIIQGNTQQAQAPAQPAQPGQAYPTSFSGNAYGNLSPYTPLPYQAFGAIPQVNPALIQGGDISQQLGPYASAVDQSMQPLFQQQSDFLNQDLASRGILQSGAANYAQGNLLAQQFADVLGGSLPYAQNNLQSNQTAQNAASLYNANSYGNVTSGNQNAYNNYLNTLYGSNLGNAQGLIGQYAGSFNNPGATDLLGQGLGNASNAYQNAYGSALQNSGPLASAFGNIFQGGGSAAQDPALAQYIAGGGV